jgi:cobalt-zinc-cadmium efflux system membrane fusion protein
MNAKATSRRRKIVWTTAVAAMLAIGLSVWVRVRAATPEGHPPTNPAAAAEKADPKKDDIEKVKLTPEAMRKFGIRTGVAKKRKLTSHLIAPARLSFNTEAMAVIGVAVQGRVAEVKVRAGDSVKKRDELLIVESPELGEAQSDLLQKRTAVITAEGAVEPAKGAFDRAKTLFQKSQGISLTELQKREVEYKAAQNALLTAQAASAAAENKLSLLGMDAPAIEQLTRTSKINPKYVVRSPLAGMVVERTVNLGELVKPEREKLLVVADTSALWAIVDVPEARLREVTKESKVTISVPAAGDKSFDGTVSHVAPSVDEATRSVKMRVEIKADPSLKPGMFAQADITSKAKTDNGEDEVLAVPDGAIQTVNGSTAVFIPVKGEENTFAVRLVSVGDTIGGTVSIISGLNEGEPIVTAGTFILKADLLKASAKDED